MDREKQEAVVQVFWIALMVWLAPALALGVALLWVCWVQPRRAHADQAQETATDRPAEDGAAGSPQTSAVPG